MSNYNRRDMLKRALVSGVGLGVLAEQLGGIPLLGTQIDRILAGGERAVSYDAFHLIGQALQGKHAFLGVHQAMAADESDWAMVQIKVCNHIYAPLMFALGQLGSDGKLTVGANVKHVNKQAGPAGATLLAKGVEEVSNIPRFQNLRLNRWFADMLQNGTADGLVASSANTLGLTTSDSAARWRPTKSGYPRRG